MTKWRRVERRDATGRIRDWVEVGECERCGQGVDRAFPVEYRQIDGRLVCRACVPAARPEPAPAGVIVGERTGRYFL